MAVFTTINNDKIFGQTDKVSYGPEDKEIIFSVGADEGVTATTPIHVFLERTVGTEKKVDVVHSGYIFADENSIGVFNAQLPLDGLPAGTYNIRTAFELLENVTDSFTITR